MSVKVGYGALVALVLAAISTVANASADRHVLHEGNFDGRFYEVVGSRQRNHLGRLPRAAAEVRRRMRGVQGHLATINSAGEDEYVHGLVSARSTPEARRPGSAQIRWRARRTREPGCGWKWINGETIAPAQHTAVPYTNWQR